ncbi:MAG: cell division protein ZapA [Deltaproteobacteria bacterium]|jgi:cell division protein ZapA (FtsZ GTPase activity inhibitor)|nr:cell division protein ZapA [Deltaproteobacteria bacterium]
MLKGASPFPLDLLDQAPLAEPQVVEIEVMDRPYQIRSDRPELTAWIAHLVNEQAAAIRRHSPKTALPDLDVLVRVSFRLAISLFFSHKELETQADSIKTAEARIETLSEAIEKLLPPL